MGGWIKLEKDLRDDPRVYYMGKQLCNAQPLQGVTLVLGGLAQLWMLADTHIRNDDVLPLGIDDINQIIGVQNFCEILPPDWLQVIDSHNVKLPDFHTHNGTVTKKRALAARRVANYRAKGNGEALRACNAHALPDLDPDLDLDLELRKKKSIQKKKVEADIAARKSARRTATRLPEDWAPDEAALLYAKKCLLNGSATAEAFRDYWLASNQPTATKRDWSAAWRTWCRRSREQRTTGFGGNPAPVRDDSTAWEEIKTRGAACGFREPWPLESLAAYQTAVKFQESSGAKSVLARIAAHHGGT